MCDLIALSYQSELSSIISWPTIVCKLWLSFGFSWVVTLYVLFLLFFVAVEFVFAFIDFNLQIASGKLNGIRALFPTQHRNERRPQPSLIPVPSSQFPVPSLIWSSHPPVHHHQEAANLPYLRYTDRKILNNQKSMKGNKFLIVFMAS